MIYCDTNILIRLITNDVPHLRQAAQLRLAVASPGEIIVPDAVICEIFFVLQNSPLYRLSRHVVCVELCKILGEPALSSSAEAILAITIAQKHPKLDIVDCLLAAYASSQAANVLTFDKDLQKILQ